MIIFKGKTTRSIQDIKSKGGVVVTHQKKTWMDEDVYEAVDIESMDHAHEDSLHSIDSMLLLQVKDIVWIVNLPLCLF